MRAMRADHERVGGSEVPRLSIVIPLFNEEESVEELADELIGILSVMGEPYEVVFIDDGSSDSTVERLRKICARNESVRVIRFPRNFGQTSAIQAGFEAAAGEIVITMDGDLQNDPADIPRLIEEIRQGFDVVSGWRKNRQDKFLTRKLPS